jgi:hypothetical protein
MHYNITEIESNKEKGYLKLEISGKRVSGSELQHAKEALTVIKAKCEENKLYKALAIMCLTGEMPFMKAFQLGAKAEQFGWGREYKIAAVYADNKSRETMSFAENVTVNRGYKVGVFENEDKALLWLLEEC